MRRAVIGLLSCVSAWAQCSGYGHSATATVHHALVAGNLTNFTVTLSGTWNQLATVANGGQVTNASGYDICFANSGNTATYSWDLESYSPTTGTLVAHIGPMTLSSTADAVFSVYWGNSAVTTFQGGSAGSAWDANFAGIWHLGNGSTLNLNDSSVNANNGSPNGAPTATTGVADGALNLASASSQYVSIPASSALEPGTGSWTFGTWVQTTSGTDGYALCNALANGYNQWCIEKWTDNYARLLFWDASGPSGTHGVNLAYSGATINDGNWHQIVGVYNSSTKVLTLYLDGASVAASSALTSYAGINVTAQLNLGRREVYWNGGIDEVRVSNAARSPQWIQTEYNNLNAPGNFVTLPICSITTSSLPAGSVGNSYVQTVGTSGCVAPSFSAASGLPPGLSIAASTGVISGTPTTVGNYSFSVSVADANGSPTQPLSIQVTGGCTGYAYSATLTVAQVTAPLANFPVLVSASVPPQNVLTPQANDICVSNTANTVTYPIQWLNTVNASNLSTSGYSMDGPVHNYNWATGKVNFVFQAPSLSATAPTTFTIWAGNPFATIADSSLVWDSNTQLVAHLQELIGGYGAQGGSINAVTGAYNTNGTASTRVTGLIGFAQSGVSAISFGGSGTNCFPSCNGETVSALVKIASGATPSFDLLNGGRYQGAGAVPDLQVASGVAWCYGPNTLQGPAINDGNWHHLACASGPANNAFYVDGVAVSGTLGESDGYNPTITFAGGGLSSVAIQEGRVSNTARSAAWIAAEANDLLHPSTFVSIGTWSFSAGAGPAISAASLAGNSPNSLQATWTTSAPATSQVLCGTVSGGPYTYFTPLLHPVQSGNSFWGVTSHAVAITGLPNNTSGTAYYCVARSIDANGRWTTSAEMQAGTLAALTSTAMKVSYVSPATRPNDQPGGQNGMPVASCWFDGDTQYSTWAADGNQYGMCEDCGGPQNGSTGGNPAVLMLKWNDRNHLCGTELAYGGSNAGGYPAGSSWDSIGPISVNGVIYHAVGRREGPFCCNSVLKTTDYWSHSLAPQHNTGPSSAPVAGIDWPSPGNAMFNRGTMLTAWVQYGQDYNSSGSLPWYAGADGWVYALITDNGIALTRTRIEDMPLQDPSRRQYYAGAQVADDGLYDAAWSYDYTRETNLMAASPMLTGTFSKFSMTFIPDFNRFALITNPQDPGSAFTAGTGILDCPYPWSVPMPIGTAPRSQVFISHYPGFGQLLSATYSRLNSSPLSATITLSTASGYTYASNPAWDDYSTLTYAVGLGAAGDRVRPASSTNSRTGHIPGGLDLDYEFNGNTGDSVLVNASPNDPIGQYNTAVTVTSSNSTAKAFYIDQYGMYNFGFSNSNGRGGLWAGPQYYTLTTPYTKALTAFTALLVWGHYPASVTANGTTYTLTIPSGETVAAKGTDLVIQRNGTTASSWNVLVGGVTVATGLSCADGSFCAFVVRRDASNNVTVYRSNSIQASLPLTPDASANVTAAWGSSALTLGSSLVGEISESLIWSRALSDAELIREMGVVRRNMAVRGVNIQ